MKAGEVWADQGKRRLHQDQLARRDAIISAHSRNRQARRAALRALKKVGLS